MRLDEVGGEHAVMGGRRVLWGRESGQAWDDLAVHLVCLCASVWAWAGLRHLGAWAATFRLVLGRNLGGSLDAYRGELDVSGL